MADHDPTLSARQALEAALTDEVLNRALEKRADTYLASLRLEVSKALAPLLVDAQEHANRHEVLAALSLAESIRGPIRRAEMDALRERAEAAERLVAEPREPWRCATCANYRPEKDEHSGRPLSYGRCCHPSEAHPLHWQETAAAFGCVDHEPLPSPASEAK